MNSSTPPVIAFELGVGEFRIVTPEAVYQIKVCHDLVEAVRVDEEKSALAVSGGVNKDVPQPASFFQEISEELFDKIGQLARKLSVSVEELPEQLDAPDLDETDQQLENAKGQLEEVVKITEKASMTIMDTADSIQTDMDALRNQLDILQNLDLMAAPAGDLPTADGSTPQINILDKPPADPIFFDKLRELRVFIESLLNRPDTEATSAVEPPPTAPPVKAAPEAFPAQTASQTIMVTRFDVDVVFQTLYELCTNESVKDHIEAMREVQHTAFNTEAVANHLSELAPTVDEEDGFFNFPITAVLKSLYGATASEDFRLTLKKMNQTAASIFLDSVLPIEGETMEVEVPLETEAASPAEPAPPTEAVVEADPDLEIPTINGESEKGCSLDDLKIIKDLAAEIERLGSALAAPVPAAEAVKVAEGGPIYTSILTKDRDTIVATVSMAHNLIHQTGAHLTRILEALSFQDLSGQRIMKVVSLIGDVQMQLLSILISVNAKLKVHQEAGVTDAKSPAAEKRAQEEVDKALEKMSGGSPSSLMGPGAEARLDQGAVNDLLAQLGF